MTIAPLDGTPDTVARWVAVLAPARQLAEILAGTEFVPKAMRGKPDQVCAAILYGDELGLGPMQALAGLDVVEGKPRPSSELARALILRDGHTLVVHEATGTRVRVSGLRAGAPESERVTVEWTTDMARAAGLLNKSNWRSYPRAMLMARATGDLARLLFPDVIKGLGHIAETAATADDVATWAPDTGAVDPAPVAPPIPRQIGRKTVATADPWDPPTSPGIAPPGDGATDDSRRPSGVGGEPESGNSGTRAPRGTNEPDAPDLPPERPDDPDPDAQDANDALPIRETQRRGLFAAVGRLLGPDAQRDVRLSLVSAILGRDVTSTNELTRGDADWILHWFNRLERGEVQWTMDDAGDVYVSDTDQPDPWADHHPTP